MTNEEWRPVVGFEGYYEVSDQGRVLSCERVITRSNGVRMTVKRRLIKLGKSKYGYPTAALCREGKGRTKEVHLLVLEAFGGSCPEGKEACHNNGDPSDNRLENLRWDTHSNNTLDKQRHGTDHERNKTRCPLGHELREPNLVAYRVREGHRVCLSCARGRAKVQRRPDLTLKETSDEYYHTILSEES